MSDPRNATLAQVVSDVLRQWLYDGVYVCGDRLAEISLAREFSVSQNTVRDALSVLEREGWLVKAARRGVFVRTFNADDAEELYTLWASVERLALGWAFDAMTTDDKMHLSNVISEARIQAGMQNWRGIREAIFAFHGSIIQMSGKPRTRELLETLHNQARLLENIRAIHDPYTLDAYAQILTEYGELVTHIRYNQRPESQAALHNVIMTHCQSLLAVIDLVL